MYEKNKRKLMMEQQQNLENEIYQRRKRCWLSYGRACLTIGILGLLTVCLYAVTQTVSGAHEEHNLKLLEIFVNDDHQVHKSGSIEDQISKSESNDKTWNHKIVERSVGMSQDKNNVNENFVEIPKNFDKKEENVQSLNNVDSDINPKVDKEHLKLIRRQQNSNQLLRHRHSDGDIYYFKGYKCVPIRKSSKSSERLGPEGLTDRRT
ncbi:CLUMA_CG007090, isoform A, partial [Clunio marinus]